MTWIESPESSTIARFAYDPAGSILMVEFLKGGSYRYFDVPESVFEEMRVAASKGQFLAARIKGKYRFARS